jgi:predicted nucleotidyltransferase
MSNRKLLTAIQYKDREKAFITIAEITEPYGEGSETVVSVGSTLKGDIDNPSWKVHVPVYMIDQMIAALNDVKRDEPE